MGAAGAGDGLRAAASVGDITIDGATDAIASADPHGGIEELAAAAGVIIASSDRLPAESCTPDRRVGQHLAVVGEYDSLVKLLAAIEAASPMLVVDNLHIHGMSGMGQWRARGSSRQCAAASMPTLRSTAPRQGADERRNAMISHCREPSRPDGWLHACHNCHTSAAFRLTARKALCY